MRLGFPVTIVGTDYGIKSVYLFLFAVFACCGLSLAIQSNK